jgi:L,D-transpeptidase YcbB
MSKTFRSFVAGFGLLTGAQLAVAAEPAAPSRLVNQADVIGISVKQSLIAAATAGKGPFDIATVEGIERAYEQHGNVPMWVDGNGYTPKAQAIIEELKRASDWGLTSADYAVPPVGGVGITNAKLAEAELILTRAAVKYARDSHSGRFDPQRISELIDLMSTPPDPVAILTGLSAATDPASFLVSFSPRHPEFEQLRQKYLALRGNQPNASQARIPDGPRLRKGDTSADIPLIRARLRVFAAANADPQLYDEPLYNAVRDFQDRAGYRVDGVITPGFRRALNNQLQSAPPKTAQIDKILANMERWRWLPENLGEKHIFDNVPEFMTRVVNNGQIVHQARIVVGKIDTPTPIFSKNMQYVEFHPFWKVPDSIKMKEILPSIARIGSGALARRGLKIGLNGREINPSNINFGSSDIRAYDVYMPPGPGNALGDVKFMFPNRHSVYMHDTPSKELFANSSRAFSHGCMRVQDPHKLAEVIMSQANGWSAERTKSQFTDTGNMQVPLEHQLPVHVTYFTVRVGQDGQLQFIDDVYGHDRRTINAMAGRWNQVNKQMAPKETNDTDVMATIRSGRDNNNNSTKNVFSNGNTFADIFGGSGDSKKKKKRARREPRVRVYNGGDSSSGSSNSGFVKVARPPRRQSVPQAKSFFDLLFN